MKFLFKNHSQYFIKNKILLSLIIILFLCTFIIVPFFYNLNLLHNYNWIVYFVIYSLTIIMSSILCHFFFISTKKNKYDQLLNSMYYNSRKIFVSKYLFLITIFGILSILMSMIVTICMFIAFKNSLYNFLYLIMLFFSNFIVFNAFFWIFSLISSFSKKHIYKNISNIMLGFTTIFPLILTKSFSNNINKKFNNEIFTNLLKVVEFSKTSYKTFYAIKNFYQDKVYNKAYFDLINSFYYFPITLFNKNLSHKYDILKLNDLKFSTYIIQENIEKPKWNDNNSYYIYDFNIKPTILLNNNELLHLIDSQIYKYISNKNIIHNLEEVINKLDWNKSLNSSEINNMIELLSGKDNINIQYLRRDWKNIFFNNAQLQTLLIKKFHISFWNLLNDFYSTYSFNSYLNIDNVNGDFYFDDNINTINAEYNLNNKISEFDADYIKKYFIHFSDNEVYFNIDKSSKFKISLNKFNKVFENIKNQNDWCKLISENAYSMKNINEILNKLYSFNDEFNSINEIRLLPNCSIDNYYGNVLTFSLKSDGSLNLLYTFLLFIIVFITVPFVVFKANKGDI